MDLKNNHNTTDKSSNINNKSCTNRNNEKISINSLSFSKQNQNGINNLMRKYSYDPKIYIKNFVPVLRPKENDKNLIPSKLILNCKKRNSSTLSNPSSSDDEDDISKEELNISNSFVTSITSESSSDTDNEENDEIKNTRKRYSKIRKSSLYRNKSKKILKNANICLDNKNINKKEDEFKNISKDKCLILMPKKSLDLASSIKNKENDLFNTPLKKQRNRINSFSILETLRNNLK